VHELAGLGARNPSSVPGGVAFEGDAECCYAANLRSRLASRVLWEVAQFRYAREFHIGGPSHSISSEETSGLRALQVAVHALQARELDLALAGAVDIRNGSMSLPGLGIRFGSVRGGVDFSLADLGLKVFPVVILGGLDSIPGAIIGGVLIGVLENLAGGYLDPILGGGVKEVAPFVALVIILMLRPHGFFGKREIERV